MLSAVQFLIDHHSLRDSLRRAAHGAVSVRILAAWATCGVGVECLSNCRAPHKRAVIGTTFAVTEPAALQRLMRLGFDLRVVDQLPNGGTFHPKMYLFEQPDGTFVTLVGSANLTDAAFTRNSEVLVRMHMAAASVSKLVTHFERCWSGDSAQPVTDAWFDAYAERYRIALLNRERDIARAERTPGQARVAAQAVPKVSDLHALMQSDWTDYVRKISDRADLQDGYLDADNDSYLHTLSLVTPLLRSGLATVDQKSVARILGRHECGWLGTVQLMRGRAARLGDDAELRALVDDCLRPLWNAASDADCLAGAEGVFERLGLIDGFGPGFITRILAIARPDRFYSCNVASSSGLASLFGVPNSRLCQWKGYRDGLNVVYSTRWYNSPEPSNDRLKRLWNARVALLDAYAYQMPKS